MDRRERVRERGRNRQFCLYPFVSFFFDIITFIHSFLFVMNEVMNYEWMKDKGDHGCAEYPFWNIYIYIYLHTNTKRVNACCCITWSDYTVLYIPFCFVFAFWRNGRVSASFSWTLCIRLIPSPFFPLSHFFLFFGWYHSLNIYDTFYSFIFLSLKKKIKCIQESGANSASRLHHPWKS